MKCKKCGFVLEEGQSFCNMCGAEQDKIKEKQKSESKSVFGVLSFTSKNHRKMWFNLVFSILLLIYTFSPLDIYEGDLSFDISAVSILLLLSFFIMYHFAIGYKNPESTYTKKYKYSIRLARLVVIAMVFYLLFINNSTFAITEFFKGLLGYRTF